MCLTSLIISLSLDKTYCSFLWQSWFHINLLGLISTCSISSIRRTACGRHNFERMSNSFEVIACETILQDLLQRMANGPNLSQTLDASRTQCWTPPLVITFQDVENARAVSKLWKRRLTAVTSMLASACKMGLRFIHRRALDSQGQVWSILL